MIPAIDSLILDLDGTLLDSKPGIVESFSRAAKEVFPDVSLDISKVPVGPPVRRICTAVFPSISEAEVERLARAYREHYDSVGCWQTRLYDGGVELLSHCAQRNLPVDIATNKPAKVTRSILERLKIGSFFRCVTTVDSSNPPFTGKTAMIRHLLQVNRLNPE
ncbi:MAG TPA: HAD hydrolase-like protein, partial [Verrucomicrobiae bacterium]